MAVERTLAQAQGAFDRKDFDAARRLAAELLAAQPHLAAALALLANAANAEHDYPAAANAIARLRALQPPNPALDAAHALALNNAGSLRFRAGDLADASRLYQRALAIDPQHRLALANLAACAERLREHELAARTWRELARLEPANVAAALGLSRALRALARDADAATALSEAQRRAARGGEFDVALECLRVGARETALSLLGPPERLPDAALGSVGRVHAMTNSPDDARSCHAIVAARAAQRGDERARFQAELAGALVLARVHADATGLARARAEHCAAVDRLVGAWPPERVRRAGVELDDLAFSRFALAYQGGDDLAPARQFGDWLAGCAAAIDAPAGVTGGVEIDRIGFVGARWTQGTIAAYFGSWIGALAAAGKEVYFFTLGDRDDATSAALAAEAHRAQRLPRPLAAAAARLREARLDLIIYPEVGLDGATQLLAALRLAPRQWAAWGHPVTTGLPTIDRYISVATMEPADAAAHYREPLALLPGLGTRYRRVPRAGGGGGDRGALGLPARPLYALPHAPVKMHPDLDALLVRIAQRDRDACFVTFRDEVPALDAAWLARIGNAFAQAGLDAAKHVLRLPRLPIDGFRRMLAGVDVVVDSLHFSGGNTSLDALAQGTPVVTVESRYMRGRQSAAMLRMLGADEAIAGDIDAAADTAADLAHFAARRGALSAAIVANAANLFDSEAPLLALRELVAGCRSRADASLHC